MNSDELVERRAYMLDRLFHILGETDLPKPQDGTDQQEQGV